MLVLVLVGVVAPGVGPASSHKQQQQDDDGGGRQHKDLHFVIGEGGMLGTVVVETLTE